MNLARDFFRKVITTGAHVFLARHASFFFVPLPQETLFELLICNTASRQHVSILQLDLFGIASTLEKVASPSAEFQNESSPLQAPAIRAFHARCNVSACKTYRKDDGS